MDINNYISMLNNFSNATSWSLIHIKNPLVSVYEFKLVNIRGLDFAWI